MSGIELDPVKGVNPKLCYCPRCGGESPELVLVGKRDYVDICLKCNMHAFGGKPRGGKCPSCKTNVGWRRRKLEDGERLPGGPCKSCKDEIDEHDSIVRAGGVFWRCVDCKQGGVIRKNDFATAVRDEHGLTNGEPCGVEFSEVDCPACSTEA